MSELHRALRPVRARLRRIRLLRGMAVGALVASLLCLGMMIASFFMPLRSRLMVAGLVLAAGVILAGLFGALRPVRDEVAAQAADACGLRERAQTALHSTGDGPMEQLLREDARRALETFDPATIPLPRLRKPLLCAGAALLLCAGLMLVPNPQDAAVRGAIAFERAMEEAAAQAEDEARREDENLTEAQRQELRKLLTELSRELRRSDDAMEALLALDHAQERLEALRETMAGDAMEQLAAALNAQGMDALSQAISESDMDVAAEALEGVEAQDLDAAAGQLPQEMQGAMQAAAQAMAGGDLSGARSALSQLSSAAQSSAANRLSSASRLLSGLKGAVAAGAGQGSNEGQGSGQGAGEGSGQGSGEGSGQGSGQGAGQGSGQGPGAGSGAGQGSTNLDQGASSAGGGANSGAADPRYREGEYERIYDPTRIDAAQTEVAAESPTGEGESAQVELGPGAGTLGGSVPYNQVIHDYAGAAAQAADGQNLTARERGWVADYFSALTDE